MLGTIVAVLVAEGVGERQREMMSELRLAPLLVIVLFDGRLVARRRWMACARGDVALDLDLRCLDVVRQAGDFEHGLLVAARRDDVRVGRLLDTLDGGAFRSDDEADDAVRHANLNGGLLGGKNQIIDV